AQVSLTFFSLDVSHGLREAGLTSNLKTKPLAGLPFPTQLQLFIILLGRNGNVPPDGKFPGVAKRTPIDSPVGQFLDRAHTPIIGSRGELRSLRFCRQEGA